jgi:O-antigen/teichoic acid export membrane protein
MFRGGIWSLAIRCVFMALEFITAVLMARLLGASEYGVYAYAYALIRILALPAQAGFPTLAVRETAAYVAKRDWSHLKGLLIRINQSALVFSLAVAAIAIAISVWVGYQANRSAFLTLCWALVLLPFIALGNIRGGTLRGLHKVVQGQLPENVIRPGLMLALMAGVALFNRDAITATTSMLIHLVAAAMAFALGAWMLWRCVPKEVQLASATYDTGRWLASAWPLSLFGGLQMLNSQFSIIALGVYASPEAVGVFRVVSQIALVVGFALTSINMAIAPHIARLYALGSRDQLQNIATWSARSIVVITAVLGAVILFSGRPLLTQAFGPEFEDGYGALLVLSLGQVMSALTGASMILLNMTGHERLATKSVLAAAVINVALNVIFVPAFGVAGAAWATTASLIILNVIAARHVVKRLGVNPCLN